MKTFSVLLASLSLLLTACNASSLPVRDLTVGKVVFRTEIASNPAERERGLMQRATLPETSAMLFVFPEESQRVFWMKDTPLPLSIAYISKQGVVKEILDMAPFSLAAVPSLHAVMYALEVNQGAFTRLGVHVGDQMNLDGLKGLSEAR
ncbi:MAG: DUF192 domain-containing protein [Spirochaetales bacterium]